MPYIPHADRPAIDPAVDALVAAIVADADGTVLSDDERAGRLNYALTRVTNRVFTMDRYHRAALATGVLENVKQELYRRAVAPYEDAKIADNGDLAEYRG